MSEPNPASVIAQKNWNLTNATVMGIVLLVAMVSGFYVELAFLADGSNPLSGLSSFQQSQVLIIATVLFQFVVAGVMVFHVVRIRELNEFLTSIEWNPTNQIRLYAFAGFILAIFVALSKSRFTVVGRFMDGFSPISIGLYVLSAVLLQPFIEECYFRGVLFIAVRDRFSTVAAVVSTALVFSVVHPQRMITLLPIAFGLSITKAKTRSVAACFGMHAGYNIGMIAFQLIYWR